MRLTTFGGVALRATGSGSAGEDRRLPRRGLALLVLVAAAPGAGLSRDSIVAYLWPESDAERARGALRQTLFSLRRDLNRPDLFLGGSELVLNPSVLTSDVQDLHIARAAGSAEQIVELHAGPFLDGFHLAGSVEFEHWVDRQRTEYAAWVTRALESLARGAAQRGDQTAAAEWWRRLVVSDPLNTRFVIELMATEASSGNTAGALRQAQAHEELLRGELGTAPDPALSELVARLRRGESLTVRPATPPKAPASRLAAVPEPEPAVPGRFQDRLTRELADRYVIEEAAGTARDGGTRLLSAHDRRHDRRVTLKVMHPALASQIDVERFVREIRLTGRLAHPHILPLLDSGEVAGRPWFAVPRPEGETLRARLIREVAIPLPEAVRLTLELADALGYAHSQDIVHRDVCPENLVLGGGHALLTNLGIARALNSAAGVTLTDTGALVGSAAYMSPEQAEGSRTVDGRSDVWALAAVLFEMLTGEPMFSGPSPESILAKRAAEPNPGAERLAAVPVQVRGVLRRALQRDRERRYPSMGDFGAALSAALSSEGEQRRSWRSLLRWLGRLGR